MDITPWEEHRIHLKNFVESKLDSEEDAADLLQEVGFKFTIAQSKHKKIENPKAWLFQVARNTIADYYRKKERPLESLVTESSSEPCVCDLAGFVIQHYLPESYAQAVYLSDVELLPQQQIADQLQLSLSATKSRIKRGRIKLRDMITNCVDIRFNTRGQVSDFHLKPNCELPQDLLDEMKSMIFLI